MGFKEFIQKQQNKPYDAKIRLLWTAVAVTAVVVIIIWIVTLKFREVGTPTAGNDQFHDLWNNVKQIGKVKFKN